jgi:hypothetical protein
MTETSPNPLSEREAWGLAQSLTSMHGAYSQYLRAHRRAPPEFNEATAAVTSFLNAACVLDEAFGGTRDTPYLVARDADPDGRVVRALRFARDRVQHDANVVIGLVFTMVITEYPEGGPPPSHGLTGADLYWQPAALMTEPPEKKRDRHYERRRAEYVTLLEGRDPHSSLAAARRFLAREVAARDVQVSVPDEPL